MSVRRKDRVYPPVEPAEHSRWVEAAYRRQERGWRRQRAYQNGLDYYYATSRYLVRLASLDRPFALD